MGGGTGCGGAVRPQWGRAGWGADGAAGRRGRKARQRVVFLGQEHEEEDDDQVDAEETAEDAALERGTRGAGEAAGEQKDCADGDQRNQPVSEGSVALLG